MTETMTTAQFRARVRTPKPNKYHNKHVIVGSERFDSMKEARRHFDLTALQKAGWISGLERQPRFALIVNGKTVTTYVGDWRYTERQQGGSLKLVVEDCKSTATAKIAAFRIKWKWCQAQWPEISWRLS